MPKLTASRISNESQVSNNPWVYQPQGNIVKVGGIAGRERGVMGQDYAGDHCVPEVPGRPFFCRAAIRAAACSAASVSKEAMRWSMTWRSCRGNVCIQNHHSNLEA